MKAHKLIAAAVIVAALPMIPACTHVTAGRADVNAKEWLEDYDAKAAAEDAERKTPTTTTPTPQMPAEYAALGDQIQRATTEIKQFWIAQGIDLNSVGVRMVSDESRARCKAPDGTAVNDGWTCGRANEVSLYLPLLNDRYRVGGVGYPWFVVGHEFGHMVDDRQPTHAPEVYVESLADCLSGAAAAGVGMADEVLKATDSVYPTSTKRHNAVSYGITHGYSACISVAK